MLVFGTTSLNPSQLPRISSLYEGRSSQVALASNTIPYRLTTPYRTIAVTPRKLSTVPWEATCKISRDYAVTAIQTLDTLRPAQEKPLRFLYVSGHFAPRSRAEIPPALENHGLVDYGLLRVRGESDKPVTLRRVKRRSTTCAIADALLRER